MKIIIAIDGFSGCGKSTLARQLAEKLHYIYIDTGAMYRAITLFLIQHHIPLEERAKVKEALNRITLYFEKNTATGKNEIRLNGEEVEEEIRKMAVTRKVSEVAAISSVRQFAVEAQRKMAEHKGVVMDGRDIGTVVFPNAELKVFLTADPEVRVERRFLQLLKKDPGITRDAVRKNLAQRDYIDSHRQDSPLRQARDAVVIDNSNLTEEAQLQKVLQLFQAVAVH